MTELRTDATDLTAVDPVAGLLRAAWEHFRRGGGPLLVDLTRVERADTKLVAALVTICRRARTEGVPVRVVASEAVLRALKLCRLEAIATAADPPMRIA